MDSIRVTRAVSISEHLARSAKWPVHVLAGRAPHNIIINYIIFELLFLQTGVYSSGYHEPAFRAMRENLLLVKDSNYVISDSR